MDQELFSNTLKPYTDNLENPVLRDSLNEICQSLDITEPRLYVWDSNRLALAISIAVELPTLGNYNCIDIRATEPILVVFDIKKYPTTHPMVFTDRLSFPKDRLAHLYIAAKGKPPAFCLIRGSFSDWYASKRPTDLIIRIGNWLRDAATGNLSDDGGQFDPMRLEKYVGTLVYNYDQLAKIVNNNEAFVAGSNFAVLLFKREEGSCYKVVKPITDVNYLDTLEELVAAYKKEDEDLKTEHYHVGYVVWGDTEVSYDQYLINVPHNWEEFQQYAADYGISLDGFENHATEKSLNYFKGVPVILAIRRPLTVIGYSENIEFSNHILVVGGADMQDGKIVNNVAINFYAHNQILTQDNALRIAGQPEIIEKLSVVLGCGALGSKIVMHLARSGNRNLILVDPDKIAPHNMVRHALLGDQIGQNKAEALVSEIKKIFPDHETDFASLPSLGDPTFKDGTLSNVEWVFDFTASENVLTTIANAETLIGPKICRSNISDGGNLGISLFEGNERIPRIDDLQVSLFSNYDNINWISEWLQREADEASNSSLNVNVGVGCNSETTVLSDEIISSHAAYFTGVLRKEAAKDKQEGKIFLNRIINNEEYSIETTTIHVAPFHVMKAINNDSWSIRFKHGLKEQIINEMLLTGDSETGGVFVGVVNYKTKTIHVTDVIAAPPDSQANAVCFYRGHEGLPAKIDEITHLSGNQLGYIGEWHSHPHGPNGLSPIDMDTVQKFKQSLDELLTPLPVFLTVVTPDGLLPFVF